MPTTCLNDQYYTSAEVCRMIPPARRGATVSPSTIWRWIHNGVTGPTGERIRLGAIRLGGRTVVPADELAKFLDALRIPQPAAVPISRSGRSRNARRRAVSKELDRILA